MAVNKYTTHVCARCRRTFGDLKIRRCYNHAVNRALGEYICYYCCKRCKFHTKTPYCGAIGCDYKNHDTKN